MESIEKNDNTKNKSTSEILKPIREDVENATLVNVYKIAEKWLGIKIKDRNRIDIILATALSNQIPGTPIWLFLVGPSGDWKTAFTRALEGLHNIIKVDQITKNTLASGKKDAKDLGSELEHSNKILLFLDLATLTSANKEEKNIIWGQFRTLYDGDIFKKTGSGVEKKYEGCHVTVIACTTQAIRDEVLIHAQLGTRELMYDTDADPLDNQFKMDKAWENEEYEYEMLEEMKKIVCDFLTYHKIKRIKIANEIKEFLKNEAERLTILRAGAPIDRIHRELLNPVYPEVPSRLIKQFKRIFISLKSLDENYPDCKAKEIISHIVDSSGNKIRSMILNIMQKEEIEFKISELQHKTRLGRNVVKSQLEQLWNLDIIEKRIEIERIGGTTYTDYNGYETMRGGKIEEIAYYKIKGVSTHSPPTYENMSLDNIGGG